MQKLWRLSAPCTSPCPGSVVLSTAGRRLVLVDSSARGRNNSRRNNSADTTTGIDTAVPMAVSHLPHPTAFSAASCTYSSRTAPGARAIAVLCRAAGPGDDSPAAGRAWAAALRRSQVSPPTPTAWARCGARRGFTAVEGSEEQKKEPQLDVDYSTVRTNELEGLEKAEELPPQQQASSTVNRSSSERRQRGAGLMRNLDLLAVPGIGPRNLRKLVDKGIGGVAELKQLYRDKFFGKASDKMVEYLQSSVGIIHRNHAESITSFIKESVDKELKAEGPQSDGKPSQKKRLTFCVEGNISVGKSTFLQRIANETLELRDLVEIVPEPVSKWQNVGPDHFNILDAFYAEPQRYAYTFQNYVFVTRVMQERESSGGIKPLRLMERSVFSDRMVFVRAVHEANWMNEMEISIYDSWFDPVVSSLPGLIPDGFIYLRATPDTCHKRLLHRNRSEEGGVTLDYLRGLHEKHESWLFPSQSGKHGVLSVSQLPFGVDASLHPDIKDRVFYLEGDHMHSSIQKVPALVLDCEPNIDFNRDIEAKRQYARQVAEFFEFVKKKKEHSLSGDSSMENKPTPQIMLPHQGGLWLPGGSPFPESTLKNLDFKQAMSFRSS